MDNLVIPEDSEIFVEVSCLLTLHDSPIADIDTPENIQIDEDHDPLKTQLEKVQRITENNREVRASTSMDSIQSYESIKAEKHFQNQLIDVHIQCKGLACKSIFALGYKIK